MVNYCFRPHTRTEHTAIALEICKLNWQSAVEGKKSQVATTNRKTKCAHTRYIDDIMRVSGNDASGEVSLIAPF